MTILNILGRIVSFNHQLLLVTNTVHMSIYIYGYKDEIADYIYVCVFHANPCIFYVYDCTFVD